MHITLETDYAIRIVDCLARDGGRLGANVIAERTCVTQRFSLKILRKLVSSGIVRSYKGAAGGYVLAKPTCEITLGSILETIEGAYFISRCLRDGHICTLKSDGEFCPYHNFFSDISADVRERLNTTTIADMMNEKSLRD